MKKRHLWIIGLIVVCFFGAQSQTFAQWNTLWLDRQHPRGETPYGQMYNPKTVETLKGEVIYVRPIIPLREMDYGIYGTRYGIYLMLKTDKEEIPVHLGPGWFVENQDFEIQAKDKIEVKGSRTTLKNKPAIVASEIKVNNVVFKFRDEDGYPAWVGWKRKAD